MISFLMGREPGRDVSDPRRVTWLTWIRRKSCRSRRCVVTGLFTLQLPTGSELQPKPPGLPGLPYLLCLIQAHGGAWPSILLLLFGSEAPFITAGAAAAPQRSAHRSRGEPNPPANSHLSARPIFPSFADNKS